MLQVQVWEMFVLGAIKDITGLDGNLVMFGVLGLMVAIVWPRCFTHVPVLMSVSFCSRLPEC